MSESIRATKHNGRVKKNTNEGYNPKHNDRQYDDKSKLKRSSEDNLYYINGFNYILSHNEYLEWTNEQHENGQVGTFEEFENLFYEKMFKEQYNIQMEKHIKGGHRSRVKPFSEWKKDKRYVPEETHLQIGNKDNQIPREIAEAIFIEYLSWEQEWGNEHRCFKILDFAIHEDETTVHVQSRRVWFSENENGIYEIGQAKALERAGIPLPNPNEPRSRYNNAKMTFDKLSREKYLSICEEHGINVERVPIPDAVHNLDKEEMIHRKHTEKEKQLNIKEKLIAKEQKRLQKLGNDLLNDTNTVKGILNTYTSENVENGQIRALEEYLSTIKFRDGSTALERFRRKQETKKQEIRRDTSMADAIMERWNIQGNIQNDDFQMGQ